MIICLINVISCYELMMSTWLYQKWWRQQFHKWRPLWTMWHKQNGGAHMWAIIRKYSNNINTALLRLKQNGGEENTQWEDWLLPTEPRHETRPRQTGAENPPAMEDSVFKEAADLSSAVRHRNGTLRLSPGRRIDMEEISHLRGGGASGPWASGCSKWGTSWA